MKHGKAHRRLSRPTAHRMLMLRNLVSSLLQYQQVKTTLAKAKEAAPLAEKMITLAKKGSEKARQEIQAFVLNQRDTLPLLYQTYVPRYSTRPGGYTRIHKYGNRFGDHAPMAILELVDNPQDIRFEITARAVGREVLGGFVRMEERERRWGVALPADELADGAVGGVSAGAAGAEGAAGGAGAEGAREGELDLNGEEAEKMLRPNTRLNRAKVLKYRGPSGVAELNAKAREYVNELLREPDVLGGLRRVRPMLKDDGKRPSTWDREAEPNALKVGKTPWAGERLTGMDVGRVGLNIARGALGRKTFERPRMMGWDEGKEREWDEELDRLEREEMERREEERRARMPSL